MKMKQYPFILAILLHVFAACEYDTSNVYQVDVPRPAEGTIDVNLADFPAGATIYIYQRTKLNYHRELPEGELLKQHFSLSGRKIEPANGYIELEPTRGIEAMNTLTVDIEVDSRSESIAGKLGLENYTGRFEYTIIFIPNAALRLTNIAHHRNQDDYFELTWDKPELEQYTVDRYRITYYHNRTGYVKEITAADETRFVDSLAVFGTLHYTIETFFKETIRERWINTYTTEIRFPKSSIQFEYTGVNSGIISWPQNEYRSKYALGIGYYGEVVYVGTENYFEINDIVEFTKNKTLAFPFGHAGVWTELYVMPLAAGEPSRGWPLHIDNLYSPGLISLTGEREYYKLFADTSLGRLFIKNGKEFWVYDVNNLQLLAHETVDAVSGAWDNRAFYSEKSSKIFLAFGEGIELVSHDFKNHEKVHFDLPGRLNYYEATLGTNDVVYIRPIVDMSDEYPEDEADEKGLLYAIDFDTRTVINSLVYPNKWDNLSVSRDGKYIALHTNSHINGYVTVYEFSPGGFNEVYREDFPDYGITGETVGIYFNEKESHRMIITLDGKGGETRVVNLKDGTKTPRRLGLFVRSDPFTGNVVISRGVHCSVYDSTFSRLIFEQERTDIDFIFNNYFFTSGWGDRFPLYYFDFIK